MTVSFLGHNLQLCHYSCTRWNRKEWHLYYVFMNLISRRAHAMYQIEREIQKILHRIFVHFQFIYVRIRVCIPSSIFFIPSWYRIPFLCRPLSLCLSISSSLVLVTGWCAKIDAKAAAAAAPFLRILWRSSSPFVRPRNGIACWMYRWAKCNQLTSPERRRDSQGGGFSVHCKRRRGLNRRTGKNRVREFIFIE